MTDTGKVALIPFGENLDCRPIYLGYDEHESSYWFYALKEGTARFLKYVNYFHWDRGPQGILKLVPLPEEIEEELRQYLEGRVEYEFVKKRKNSKSTSVRKSYRRPSGEDWTSDESRSTDLGGDGSGCPASPPSLATTTKHGVVLRGGRPGHAMHSGIQPQLVNDRIEPVMASPSEALNLEKEMKSNEPLDGIELLPVATGSKGTGKSFKKRGVHVSPETYPRLDLGNEVESTSNVCRVELGQLGLLTEEQPRKKRGRPRKV